MKRSFKSALGVTLLEIMLVLAIAAMVIVMSIRYYQSASTNQKINVTLNNITGIVAAGESFLAATGTFTGMAATAFNPYLPGGAMPNSGFGGPMTVAATSASTYTITLPKPPADACLRLIALLASNKAVKMAAGCETVLVGDTGT